LLSQKASTKAGRKIDDKAMPLDITATMIDPISIGQLEKKRISADIALVERL
jgi:hypothetical protein